MIVISCSFIFKATSFAISSSFTSISCIFRIIFYKSWITHHLALIRSLCWNILSADFVSLRWIDPLSFWWFLSFVGSPNSDNILYNAQQSALPYACSKSTKICLAVQSCISNISLVSVSLRAFSYLLIMYLEKDLNQLSIVLTLCDMYTTTLSFSSSRNGDCHLFCSDTVSSDRTTFVIIIVISLGLP